MIARCLIRHEIIGEGEGEREFLKIEGLEGASGGIRYRVIYAGSRQGAGDKPFVARFMVDEASKKKFPDYQQRVVAAYQKWEGRKE